MSNCPRRRQCGLKISLTVLRTNKPVLEAGVRHGRAEELTRCSITQMGIALASDAVRGFDQQLKTSVIGVSLRQSSQ